VLAVARRRDRLEALEREAAEQGGSIVPLVADLQTRDGLGLVVQRIVGLGTIDLLVNNAGIATFGDFQYSSLEQEMGAIRLNVHAVVTLTHAVLGAMVQGRKGSIINVASVVAFQPFPHFAVYAASKAFVLSFSEALAEELKGSGVRILALCPGAAKTEMIVFLATRAFLGNSQV
jgi:short-subunit dehydrogenase